MATRLYYVNRYGFTYRLRVDDPIMEDRFKAGELCEQGMLDWIVANIPHGGIWVDCGANIGNHTQVFAAACEAEVVMAFEPVPDNYANLMANTDNLDNVIALRLGVGEGPALCEITPTAQGRNCQFALKPSQGKPNTAVVSLDSIVPHEGVRMMKLDIENMEVEALLGARLILEASHPELFVEVLERKDLDSMIDLLAPFGYLLIERFNDSATYHFSASGRYLVTYTEPVV